MMKISKKGLDLIKLSEGFRAAPYLCQAGVPTIGYGTTIYPNGKRVKMKDRRITKETANKIMKHQIDKDYGATVNRYVQRDMTQNQFDALVSFVYNFGAGNFKGSTLLKKVNQGKHKRAALEFPKWNRVNHKVNRGLVKRRERERQLYLA